MKMSRGVHAALVALGMGAALNASADAGGLAAGVKLGTTGLGGELVTAVTPMINVRGVVNFFDYDYDTTEDGIDYDATLELQSFGALVDLHPFKGSFRVSAGLFSNGNQAKLKASCPGQCDVGDVVIEGDEARLDGKVDFKSAAPYLGLGFGNAMSGTGLYGIFDVGVLFQGKPKARLAASGTATVTDENGVQRQDVDLANDPQVQDAVAEEQQSLQDDLDSYKLYPVVNLGIGYRFF